MREMELIQLASEREMSMLKHENQQLRQQLAVHEKALCSRSEHDQEDEDNSQHSAIDVMETATEDDIEARILEKLQTSIESLTKQVEHLETKQNDSTAAIEDEDMGLELFDE